MTTGAIQRATAAQQSHFHHLKTVIRHHRDDAMAWFKAVKEVYDTRIWMYWHPTWDDFCRQEMGMPAGAVAHELQFGKPTAEKPPKLPPPSQSDFHQITEHANAIGARLASFVKTYVKLTGDWPQSQLPDAKVRQFDEELVEWVEQFELWLADHGHICEASRKIRVRISDRKKGAKK